MLALLLLGSLADLGLAGFLVLLSGYVFGGHEGMHGEASAVLPWAVALATCFLAIGAGFLLWHYRRPGLGATVAWIPPFGTFLFTVWVL